MAINSYVSHKDNRITANKLTDNSIGRQDNSHIIQLVDTVI